jgi:hypothetical protein
VPPRWKTIEALLDAHAISLDLQTQEQKSERLTPVDDIH